MSSFSHTFILTFENMSIVLSLALIVSLTTVECGIPIPLSNRNSVNKLACQIASASSARVTFVYLEDTDEDLLRCLSSSHLPVITLTLHSMGLEKARNFSSMHLLTVDGDASSRLMQIRRMLDPRIRQKHLSKYVLIFKVPCEGDLERFFNFFWESGLLNVVALCSHQRIFTYEPFSSEGFRIVRLPPATELFKLFYDKLRNLHHFQLRISEFSNPMRSVLVDPNGTVFRGIDGLLGRTIVQQLNATARFIIPTNNQTYGFDNTHGTLTGALRDVATGAAHIGFNARNIDLNNNEYLQAVGKVFVIYLVVPKAPLVPQYLNFIRVFHPLTWFLLLINFIFVGVVFACMQRVALKMPMSRNCEYVKFRFQDIVDMLFKTAIGDPVEGFHKINSLRQFLMTWILFSYVVSCIYFAKMESVFVHPEYQQDIDRLSEFSRYKVPVYGNRNLVRIVGPSVNPNDWQVILSTYQAVPDEYEGVIPRIVAASHDNAFILRRDRADKLIARTFNNEDKRPSYHIVKEYLSSIINSYMLTDGSPFLDKFQILHFWCFEHGLLDHFEDAELHIQNIQNENYPDNEDDEEKDADDGVKRKKRAVVLTMDILQGAFYIWIIGTGFGCLGFFAELVHIRWRKIDEPTELEACQAMDDEEVDIEL